MIFSLPSFLQKTMEDEPVQTPTKTKGNKSDHTSTIYSSRNPISSFSNKKTKDSNDIKGGTRIEPNYTGTTCPRLELYNIYLTTLTTLYTHARTLHINKCFSL